MGTGGSDVRIYRRLKCLKGGEALLFTQLLVEYHRQTPAIDIAGKIQKVNLKVRASIARHGRSYANVGDAGPHLVVDFGADQVDPGQWYAATLELHVGGGCTQLTGELLAMQDTARDFERATQQVRSQSEIASRQGIAYLGAADAHTVDFHGLRRFHGKALVGANLLQKVEIADAVAAKTEIVTDLQMFHAQAVDQHGVDELGGAQLAQTLVERQAQPQVHALGGEQVELATQTRQTSRSRFRGEELTRLRLEDDHATGQAQFHGTLTQPSQDSLVTTVNTVEIANGGDAAPMLGAQIVKASNQLHNALLAHKVADYNHTPPSTTGDTSRQTATIDFNRQKPTTDPT